MDSFNKTDGNISTCQNLRTGYIISFIFSLCSFPGIVVYSFTLFIMLKKFKELNSTFYLLAIALAISDILPLILTCFYAVPCIIICGFIVPFISPIIFGWITHVCWYLQISLILIISINRFICMRGKGFRVYDKVFTLKKTICYIGISICFSIGMILMMNLSSVWSIFNYDKYYFGFDMSQLTAASFQTIYANAVVNDLVIAITIVTYFVCWCSLKIKHKQTTNVIFSENTYTGSESVFVARKNAERKLFLQFVTVSTVFSVFQVSFYILPFFVSGTIMTVITGIIYIFVCSINGYMHLMLNTLLQDEAKRLLRKMIKF